MCIVALAWQCIQTTPKKEAEKQTIPLVLLSNRDEFFDRSTLGVHAWRDLPVVGGRDIKAGGTWLGIHPNNGKWATVLNVREKGQSIPEEEMRKSRGSLVTDFLVSDLSPWQYVSNIELGRYEGFNFICGNLTQAVIVSNRGQKCERLSAGLHVFSNGKMTGSESEWFKTERLRARVRQELLPLLQNCSDSLDFFSAENILPWQKTAFQCLKDQVKSDLAYVPDTGFPPVFERAISSVFIPPLALSSDYGTRVSSVLCSSEQGFELMTKTHDKSFVLEKIIKKY